MVYSTTAGPDGAMSAQLYTQLTAVALGTIGLLVCLVVDYRTWVDRAHVWVRTADPAAGTCCCSASWRGGGRRWIELPLFNLQPSEFAKIGLALMLARLLGEERRQVPSTRELLMGGALTGLPLILIARQPDLGTAVTLVPVLLLVAFAAGMRLRIAGILLACAILSAPVVWAHGLQDYQRSRIKTFLDPTLDPRGAGYQQIQARITVGAGGLWGKGFQQGTQGQLSFLPVAHNDFIFSVLAEELGFAGVLVALALYLFVVWRSLETLAGPRTASAR